MTVGQTIIVHKQGWRSGEYPALWAKRGECGILHEARNELCRLSGESTRCRRHILVEFVVGSHQVAPRGFFPGTLVPAPSPRKPTFPIPIRPGYQVPGSATSSRNLSITDIIIARA